MVILIYIQAGMGETWAWLLDTGILPCPESIPSTHPRAWHTAVFNNCGREGEGRGRVSEHSCERQESRVRRHWVSGFHMGSLEQTRSCPADIRKGHATRREDCLLRQEVVDSRSHGGQHMSPWLKVLGKKKCFLRPLKLVTGACELNWQKTD